MEEFIHSYGLNATNQDTQKKKFVFIVSATSLKFVRFPREEKFLGEINI